jgi:hypothetical protein
MASLYYIDDLIRRKVLTSQSGSFIPKNTINCRYAAPQQGNNLPVNKFLTAGGRISIAEPALLTQVAGNRIDIIFKCIDSIGRYLAGGEWIVIPETFIHGDITRLLQFVDLNAQVAPRGTGLFKQPGKFSGIHRDQKTHNG